MLIFFTEKESSFSKWGGKQEFSQTSQGLSRNYTCTEPVQRWSLFS